jgi:hypothetical protein
MKDHLHALHRFRVVVLLALLLSGCSHPAQPLTIALESAGPAAGAITITGFSSRELAALRAAPMTDDAWRDLLRVSVAGGPADQPGVAGRYAVTDAGLQFTPLFPFDPGRQYLATLDPARLPAPRAAGVITATLALPAAARAPATTVVRLLPTADELPENLLRMYIEFSAPMSRAPARDYVRLLDEAGREVPDAFLALDVELWNPEYTRCTLFFDPGRVKRGILPNVQMGRAIRAGGTYTIAIDARWPDAHGQPLAAPFRHRFRAGPADLGAIRLTAWRIDPPRAGRRDPLVVTFPRPLDYALLARALTVSGEGGAAVPGDAVIGPAETTWRFTPRDEWRAGAHAVVARGELETPGGNRINQPFDVDRFDRVDRSGQPERHSLPFSVR